MFGLTFPRGSYVLIMYTSSCTVKILVKGELIMDTMGRHVIGELWGCNVDILNDIDQIEKVFVEAALKSGAEIREVAFHKFAPQGVSGVVIISESQDRKSTRLN